MVSIMIVGAVSVHAPHGLFAASNGIEMPLLYGAVAGSLAVAGFGAYSLDAILGLASFWTPAMSWGVLAAGILGGLANLAVRRKPVPATA
jgi:putative oxidoreductase